MKRLYIFFAITAFAFVLLSQTTLAQQRIPVILSTDVGNEIDDQWAITYLLLSPEQFDILGIASAHAPSISAPAGETGLRILKDVVENRLGMIVHPPLLQGADLPLENRNTARNSEAVEFIIAQSKAFNSRNRLQVLTIGAVTDVASAIIKDPSIVDRIRIIDMGFKSWKDGLQGQEYNIQNDPIGMQVVLDSNVPLVVGAGDVCRANLSLGFEQARQMIASRGAIGGWLWDEFSAWYFRFIKPLRKNDFSKPWVIWDNITIAYVLGMTTQEEYARPQLQDDLAFKEVPGSKATVTWITDVDEARMWSDFLNKVDHYQRTHPTGTRVPYRLSYMIP